MRENKEAINTTVISSTVTGSRFVAAEWNKNIQVWDIHDGFVSKFESELDWTGESHRISISEDGRHIAVGAYEENSVALYESDTGKLLWKKRGIRTTQEVSILKFASNIVFIHTEKNGSFLLDRNTGELIEKIRGIVLVRESPYADINMLERRKDFFLKKRRETKKIKGFPFRSFGMLDACFSKESIFCSYAGNPLEAISLETLKPIWAITVAGHFLDIEYCVDIDTLLGIRWDYNNGGPSYLCYINAKTGKIEKEVCVGEAVTIRFLCQGKFVVTNHGEVYSTISGQKVKQFDFEN